MVLKKLWEKKILGGYFRFCLLLYSIVASVSAISAASIICIVNSGSVNGSGIITSLFPSIVTGALLVFPS